MVHIRLAGMVLATGVAGCLSGPADAAEITPAIINESVYSGEPLPEGQSALAVRVQILLDRSHAAPGVIDGYSGENLSKGIRAFERISGLPADGVMDAEVWRRLSPGGAPVVVRHRITQEDVSDIVAPLPEDYSELAEREWLGYTSVAEKIAETFHMDVDLLKQLNPEVDFEQVGTEIWVADPGADADSAVARIVADKSSQQLLAYAEGGGLVSAYPVTIGSRQTPSPTGTHQVKAIAVEANYTYRPHENFTQGDNTEMLVLPPGPNGPVGLVWIDLSKPTYGIHGTAEPAEIGKTFSHGCVRMTNWDAMELAHRVSVGTTVEFSD